MPKDLTRLVRLSQSYLLPTLTDEAKGVIYDAILAECAVLSAAPEPAADDGWTPWTGGGDVNPPAEARHYRWTHGGLDGDIVAYKLWP